MASVVFHFDYASPWSYLANEILESKLPGVEIEYRPIYLRGLESFATGIPYSAAKLSYLAKDLTRCAEHEGVPLAPPAEFPVNGLYALRAAIAAQDQGVFGKLHRELFRAVWRDSRDVSKEGVAALLRELGLPSLIEAMDDPAIKQRLRENTDHAAGRGVFGVPAFLVGDELFWGHDRLDYVARALAG